MTSPLPSAAVAVPPIAGGNAPPIDFSLRDLAPARASWPLWSIFLGCSWTWCIGLFLPVLLVQEFGLLGWVVFAVPNVLGAAAMGFIIRDAQTSQRILQLHRYAIVAFSVVTTAFNCFFALWFVFWLGLNVDHLPGPLKLDPAFVVLLGAAVGLLVIILACRRSIIAEATLVLAVSLVVLGTVLRFVISHSAWPPLTSPYAPDESQLLYLVPLCILGFGACPYLDATFHWPISRLSTSARQRAFVVGFGVIFLAMIFLTLLYADDQAFPTYVVVAVALHAILQAMWKMRLHLLIARRAGLVWPILALVVGALAWSVCAIQGPSLMLGLGITIYLCFLSFYGLIFPAYVLIVMLPPRGSELIAPNKRVVAAWIVTVLLCLPCLWEGFILEHRLWLLPIILVVIAARWLAIRPMIMPGAAANA
jgi:hypothetical protein